VEKFYCLLSFKANVKEKQWRKVFIIGQKCRKVTACSTLKAYVTETQ